MSAPVSPLTALLFTPDSRLDRLAKAVARGADGLIVDREDAIGLADKEPGADIGQDARGPACLRV